MSILRFASYSGHVFWASGSRLRVGAFRLGAGMVLVAACHLPYDCHYISGNWKMKARMEALQGMLQKLGLSSERF